MEFLRFGSSIPGSYWGCCAADIIQNFKVDPDTKASIQLVEGDGGHPISNSNGFLFAGKTYKEIFLQRLRYGTFSNDAMPNHGFFVILSEDQINYNPGKKWLAILKQEGFEFVRKINNSVWDVDNYVFALFRNVGTNACKDQFTPPEVWTDLPKVVPEPWERITNGDAEVYTKEIAEAQKPLYDKLPSGVFYNEKELEKEGVPVIYAGQRSKKPQQTKEARERVEKMEEQAKAKAVSKTGKASPKSVAPFSASA